MIDRDWGKTNGISVAGPKDWAEEAGRGPKRRTGALPAWEGERGRQRKKREEQNWKKD